ncbi:MAG TPA: amidohydrolase family protein [Steroidobacteraceae bacterium]|nr:amidohydrolase family protein [Steroidobacteraceae bacterium]
MKHHWTAALLLSAGCTLNPPRPAGKCDMPAVSAGARQAPIPVPRLDHHQHLMSEAARSTTVDWMRTLDSAQARQTESEPLVNADQLVAGLDSAGIAKALVLSNAYWFSRSANEQPGEYEKVRAENDWILAQVRRHPNRLYATCSVNPRRSHAVAEIERCVGSGGVKALKLHFDASGVDVTKAEHVAPVRQTFATANRLRLPIAVHLQSEAGAYGGEQTRIFLTAIMPAAPDVAVTVLHLWGGGLYGSGPAHALAEFAEAFERNDPVTRNLWFDVAQASMMVRKHKQRGQLVERMRQIGFERLLYGSDGSQWNGVPPKQHWEEFSACMPLTRDELGAIATNVAPYLR